MRKPETNYVTSPLMDAEPEYNLRELGQQIEEELNSIVSGNYQS